MANHTMTDNHPLAGETVTVEIASPGNPQLGAGPHEFTVENWWDVLTGNSWMASDGNPAALIYGMRSAMARLPLDDEVIYGKIDGFGVLVHASELPAV